MKLVRQVSLHFHQGTSDKLYEVDLCEVDADQYVVNFRYGRRGTTLRDGIKTVIPVPRTQAEQIFDDLVTSKIAEGYRQIGSSLPPVRTSPPGDLAGKPAPRPLDPRAQAVLDRIAEGHRRSRAWPLTRAIWRAGEMRLAEAEPLLIPLAGTKDAMLDYCIAWALGQCGSPASLDTLRSIQANEKHPFHVRRIAYEAILKLSPPKQREDLLEKHVEQLPEPLREAARHGPAELFQERLLALLEQPDPLAFQTLERIYIIDSPHVRPALLHVLRTAPLEPGYFSRFRRIFKSAELRRDGEVFGIIAYRLETTRANFRMRPSYSYPKRTKPTVGPDAELAYSQQTRTYLRRRVWRTLQRFGELNDADYVQLAVGVLLPFTDADAQKVQQTPRYRNVRGRWQPQIQYRDRFANYWAFNQILYANSPRYKAEQGKLVFRCRPPYQPGGAEPAQREEAFPQLWQRHPRGLLHLLSDSRCKPVHQFAAKALRSCTEFCRELDVEVLKMLLASPYNVTARLGFDLAVARYDANRPDLQLVAALANCRVERARTQARQWIEANRMLFFADAEFTAEIVASPFADTRQFARASLASISLYHAARQAIIGRLVARLLALGADDGPLAADIAATMTEVFATDLRSIGIDIIRDLVAHPLAEIQQFAATLVLNHATLSQQPPEDVLRALLGASEPAVRAIGVRIIGQLPDHVLRRSERLLVALTRHEHADVREEVRPIVRRLAETDSQFARRIAELLVEALLVPGAPEGVPSHTARVLREDLRQSLSVVDSTTVWKLLQSRSTPAQEIGGLLLPTNVDPESLSVAEIVKLASHDVLSVREASWQMARDGVDRLRAAITSTVRLLDAKWEDSRKFAFAFFREHFTGEELTPDVLVSICDSVRPDVQQFGRQLITERFRDADGPEYLAKLSEHPTVELQTFATNYLQRYAADDLERIRELRPYFLSVLSRVNRARVAKDRVLAFLSQEAGKSEPAARLVADILARVSVTCAIGDRAKTIEAMLQIGDQYPQIELPLHVQPVEVR